MEDLDVLVRSCINFLEYITVNKPSTITDGYIKLAHKVIEWIFRLFNIINTNYNSVGIPLIKAKAFESIIHYSNCMNKNSVEEEF